MISPYAKRNYVSHIQYEHGTVLRFIEDPFGLGTLAQSNLRGTSPAADCVDFMKGPRKYKPIRTTLNAQNFIDAPPDPRLPDEE